MSASAPPTELVAELRAIMTRKGETEGARGHALVERLAGLGADGLAALRAAAKGSERREELRLRALLALGDPAADDEVRSFWRPGHKLRGLAIQLLGREECRRFLPELRAIAADRSDPDWAWGVQGLHMHGDRESVPMLLAHARGLGTPFVLLQALARIGDPAATPLLLASVAHPEKRTQVVALAALYRMGHATPIAGLFDLLADGPVSAPTSWSPGDGFRAAGALCEMFGWPDGHGVAWLADIRARCLERFGAEHLDRCRAALARGELSLPA